MELIGCEANPVRKEISLDGFVKLQSIDDKKINSLKDFATLDIACGYLVKSMNSDDSFMYLDVRPELYDNQEVHALIKTLNDFFERY